MSKIERWGNNLAIRIPHSLANSLRLSPGKSVTISVREGALIVRPCNPVKHSLRELLRKIKPKHLHSETNFGSDQGSEIVEL